MRKSGFAFCLSTIVVILMAAVVLVSISACGTGSSGAAASSTTVGEDQTTTTTAVDQTGSETTASVDETGSQTTTSVDETGSTTSSTDADTTTTEAARTTDTADHAAEFRAQYPSTESFTNSNWTTLDGAPASHIGAAVDVIGQASGDTVDPDSKYLTWQLSIPSATGTPMRALCRTNVGVDRSLLSASGWVEVRGIVVGAHGSDAGGGSIIYVESIQKAAAPASTTG